MADKDNKNDVVQISKDGVSMPIKVVDRLCNGVGSLFKNIAYPHITFQKWIVQSNFMQLQVDCQKKIREGAATQDEFLLANMSEQEIKQDFNKYQILQRVVKGGTKIDADSFDKIDEANPDFLENFWDTAQKYSSEEMQMLWSKMLSEEIKNPNTFDVAVIEKLKIMSKKQATNFNILIQSSGLNLAYTNNGIFTFDINTGESKELLKYFCINFIDLKELETLGLIHINLSATVKSGFLIADYLCIFSEEHKIQGLLISEIGMKIMQLVEKQPNKINQEYSNKVKEYCQNHNINCQQIQFPDYENE